MSEQVETTQPAPTEAAGGQSVPETTAPQTETRTHAQDDMRDIADLLSDVWDKNHAPPKPQEQAAQQVSTDQPVAAEQEPAQSSPAIDAPHSWSAEAKADWAKLPPAVQQYIAQRESEAHKAITQKGAELQTYQPIRQVLDHYRGFYQPGSEAQFVAALMAANASLVQDPAGTIRALAEHSGVDLAQLVTGQKAPATQQPSDTIEDIFRDQRLDKQVLPEVERLKGVVGQLAAHLSAAQQADVRQREQSAQKVIADFSKDKPHWGDLEQDVVREVHTVRQANPNMSMGEILAEAYDRAQWANKSVRERILSDQKRAEQDAALKDAAKKQAEAKKMAAMNVRTGAASSTPVFDGKWDDRSALEAMYDRIQTR